MNDIDVGTVYSRVFNIYGSQFLTLFGTALVINLLTALGAVLLDGIAGGILISLVSVVVGALYSGMVIKLVQDLEDGRRDSSIGELLSSVTPVLLPLLGISILLGIGIGIGFVLLIVPGLFLMTIWAVVTPVVVVERKGLGSFGRSQELVKGNGWAVFGCIIVAFLLAIVVGIIAGVIAGAIGGDVGIFIANWLVPALASPVTALVAAVIYFSLRGWGAPEAPTGLPVS